MLFLESGDSFCTGVCGYRFAPLANDITDRILLPIEINNITTEAVVDTGGIYFICSPELVELLNIDPSAALETNKKLNIRGSTIWGDIHRLSLRLTATKGSSYDIEVTAFLPDPSRSIEGLPSFLGFYGCLERLRLAIDPNTETFYFGALSSESWL